MMFTIFLSCGLISCSNQEPKPDPSSLEWYLTGYGSFNIGQNFSFNDQYKFKKNEDGSYSLKNVSLGLGDGVRISSSNNEYFVNEGLNYSSDAFLTKNIRKDSMTNDGRLNVLMAGKYDFTVTIDGKTPRATIVNSEGTKANDHLNYSNKTKAFDFFADGDHHGTIDLDESSYMPYPNIENYIAYLKSEAEKTGNQNIFISNGDLWQGTYKSNINHGLLLTEIYEKAGFKCMTMGNHEFDWGQNYIAENNGLSPINFLGANIVDRNTKKIKDFVQPYQVFEYDGIRVGVIGVIGHDQITSITSLHVNDLEFLDSVDTVKQYSDILRNDYYCEIVVASFHQGTSTLKLDFSKLTATSPISYKRYVDAFFTAHDHYSTYGVTSGVGYANSGNNGTNVSHIALEYSPNQVTTTKCENLSNGADDIADYPYKDAETTAIIKKYITTEMENKCNSVAGTTSSYLSKTNAAPDMMAKAMYEYAEANGQKVDLAIVNNARTNIESGEINFNALFTAFPFTNYTVIMDAKGSDIISTGGSNYYYSQNANLKINGSSTYKIAVYDYLAYHQNTYREYNYFKASTPFKIYATLEKAPVDIIYDYIKNIKGTINPNDYDKNSVRNFSFLR